VTSNPTNEESILLLGHHGTDEAGWPTYDDFLEGLVHEATHGYTNPLAFANMAAFDAAARRIYARTEASMEAQAYGDPRGVVIEGLVRSVVARYVADTGDTAWLGTYLADEHRRGWLIVDGLAELFGRYEADRRNGTATRCAARTGARLRVSAQHGPRHGCA
jgi:hypothetical protein